MVRWYHAIFSAYGYWLPNDPRGSWSDFVYAWELFRYGGPATKVTGRRSYAHDPHDANHRREMKQHLKFPPVRFDESCRRSIGRGFRQACDESGIVVHACAMGYDHVHLVTARHAWKSIEDVVRHLKSRATKTMTAEGRHPLSDHLDSNGKPPTPWGIGEWKVFINNEAQLRAAIDYVTRHPMKEGLPPQRWSFVTPI